MNNLKLEFNTNDMIIYHLIQRMVYQYHSLFAKYKNHPALEDLTRLWFLKLFLDNPYFQNMSNSILINYEIKEDKNLLIVIRAPLYYKTFTINLDKDINSCVDYTDNNESISDLNLFSIEFVQ